MIFTMANEQVLVTHVVYLCNLIHSEDYLTNIKPRGTGLRRREMKCYKRKRLKNQH